MITIEEWNHLTYLYINGDTPLALKDDFARENYYTVAQQKELEKKYKVSFGAYCILGSYAGRGCYELNEQLRQDKWVECDEPIQLYSNLLSRALDELPGFNNNVCYRWSNLNEAGYEYIKGFVGKIIMMPQFWSTSYKKLPASDQFFEIHTDKASNGRYISRIVEKPSEEEVLFKSRTLFELIDYDKDTIYLEEVKGQEYDLSLHEYFWEKETYSERVHKKLFPEVIMPKSPRDRLIPDF